MPLIVTPGELARRAELYHQLGASISAGIPLIKSLEMLATNRAVSGDRRAILHIIRSLQAGSSFTEAMIGTHGWLSDFDKALLATGEHSGRLDSTFALLSVYYRERSQIFRKAITDILTTLLTLHMFLLIFPLGFLISLVQGLMAGKLADCMPFIVQKLVVFGSLYGAVLFVMYAAQGTRGERWRSVIEKITASIPLLGTAVRFLNIARLSAALEALIRSGIPIITAWEMATAASGSPYLRRKVAEWKVMLDDGSTPAELVSRSPYFPEMFAHLYNSGEQSGKLDDALDRLHVYYQEEGFRMLRLFTRVLNACIYGGLVAMVGYNVIHFWVSYYGGMMKEF